MKNQSKFVFFRKMSFLFKYVMVVKKEFVERVISILRRDFPNFGQKRHGWAKKWEIVTYFSFLPTMTFFFRSVMVDENFFNFQLIRFFLENVIFIQKYHG